MTASRFELTSQRQKVSRVPTEAPGRPALKLSIVVSFCIGSTLYYFLPSDVFLPCDHGLVFDISLHKNLTYQPINMLLHCLGVVRI